MTDYSDKITATVTAATKTITFATDIALYESRSIEITLSGYDFPSATYKLFFTFGPNTVVLAALSVVAGKLTGTLNCNTTNLENIFKVLPVNRVRVKANLWDSGNSICYATGSVDVWNAEEVDGATEPTAVSNEIKTGQESITNGASTVEVDLTGEGFTTAAAVAGTIIVPSGGDNIFVVGAAVASSGGYITTITFTLSSAVANGTYKLNWMVAE
jgi:hypothetical protein